MNREEMVHTVEYLAKRLGAVETELAYFRDVKSIEDVLTRYSRAVDWLDDTMLDSVFYDDAEIDYGFFKGNGREFKPLLMKIERDIGRRWHFTSQIKIDLKGDVAEVESYNFSLSTDSASATPPGNITQFFGFYIDRMLRRDGEWGIIRRRHLYVTGVTTAEIVLSGGFGDLNKIGPTSPSHPDYRRLGKPGNLSPS